MRQHQGATQAQIAAATGLTQGRVSNLIANAQRIMHIDVIERIADGLRIPGALVGLADRPWECDEPVEQTPTHTEDPMLRRTALRAGGAMLVGGLIQALDSEPDAMGIALDATNVSGERLDYFEATADRLGIDVIQVPPNELLTAALTHFRSVRRLVHGQQKTADRVRLVRSGAKYATVIGEILFNQGDFRLATTWYRTAYHAAVDVGDRFMADIALAGQAYIPTYSDDPRTVLRITDARLSRSPSPTPAISWLWGFKAKAHAALGEATEARAAFDAAGDSLDRSRGELVQPGIFSFLPEKLALYEANAYVTLGDTAAATEATSRALRLYDMTETTEPALARFERASALVQAGEVDEACRYAVATALDPRTYPSVTVRTRALKFDAMLQDDDSAPVTHWREVMRDRYSPLRLESTPALAPGDESA